MLGPQYSTSVSVTTDFTTSSKQSTHQLSVSSVTLALYLVIAVAAVIIAILFFVLLVISIVYRRQRTQNRASSPIEMEIITNPSYGPIGQEQTTDTEMYLLD